MIYLIINATAPFFYYKYKSGRWNVLSEKFKKEKN